MYPGGRAPDPRRMKAMMRKMGIEQEELEGVERVVITMRDRELVLDRPQVMAVTAQGQTTYQVAGEVEERQKGAAASPAGGGASAPMPSYSEEDLALVMAQTGASEDEARAALGACEGQVAEAIIKLIG